MSLSQESILLAFDPSIACSTIYLAHCRPVIVTCIEVIPVHLINTHSEHFFQFGIDPVLDDAMVKELIDVQCCSVSVVEDERVP